MTIESLFRVTDRKPRVLGPNHQRLKCPSLPPFCPVNCAPLYLFSISCIHLPIHTRNFPNAYPSTPIPFPTHTFPHPYLSTPIPFHTPTIQSCAFHPRQHPRSTRGRSHSVFALQPAYAPNSTPNSTPGPRMADLKPKMTAVHDGQGRMAIYVDESVGRDAIVSNWAPRYQ